MKHDKRVALGWCFAFVMVFMLASISADARRHHSRYRASPSPPMIICDQVRDALGILDAKRREETLASMTRQQRDTVERCLLETVPWPR